MKPYELVIDEHACWGCRACEVACLQEVGPSADTAVIRVSEDASETAAGDPQFTFRINVCRHCEEPPCLEVCPESAIFQREDGIVVLDEALCTGCQACMDSCPYDAIVFDADQSVARKCNLCHHRVDHGLLPACADMVCLAHCIHFGSAEDIAARRPKGIS